MNPRVRVFNTDSKPVIVVDRWEDPSEFPQVEMDGAVVLVFSAEVDVDPMQLSTLVAARHSTLGSTGHGDGGA